MGCPKALVELGGKPLISYGVGAVVEAGLEAVVVAKPDSELPPLEFRVVREESEARHPIAGLLAALGAAGGAPVVAIACDLPFVPPAVVSHLASLDAPVALPSVDGRLHPLLARYDPSVEPALARALEHERPLREAVSSLAPRLVTEDELARFGDPRRIVFNVNSPADLEAADRMLATGADRERSAVP
jgi:molybdopterin-guanine dinucleotide biosynthesis protein A